MFEPKNPNPPDHVEYTMGPQNQDLRSICFNMILYDPIFKAG